MYEILKYTYKIKDIEYKESYNKLLSKGMLEIYILYIGESNRICKEKVDVPLLQHLVQRIDTAIIKWLLPHRVVTDNLKNIVGTYADKGGMYDVQTFALLCQPMQFLQEHFQHLGIHTVVAIDNLDITALHFGEGGIDGRTIVTILFVNNLQYIWILLLPRLRYRQGGIGRTIIDDYYLQIVGSRRRTHQRLQTTWQQSGHVVGRNDERQEFFVLYLFIL